MQSEKERNYQVFYRMCKGAPQSMRDALNLNPDVKAFRVCPMARNMLTP